MTTLPVPATRSLPDGPLEVLLRGDRTVDGFDFFQAMRLLEEYVATRTDAPRMTVRPHEGLGFPATDVRALEVADDRRRALTLVVNFLGLYGVDSPLPTYFTTASSNGSSDHETPALRDFLDIFNARVYALLYEALKKYREPSYLACLAGLGAPAPEATVSVPALVPFAGVVRAPVRNAEGLVRLIADRFPGVPVTVVENVPRWIALQSRPQLGSGANAMSLGGNALLGANILDVSGRFRIVLGPVGWEQFERLRPRGSDAAALGDIVRLYAPDFLDYEVELRIKSTDLPETRLGGRANRMGRTTWVGRPKETIVSEVVTYA
ncbi:MAG TPA: type VI secretion system baseplate subunit TssG [Gemmatimonadaceae bacterium]